MWDDLRHAARSLGRSPGFTVAAVLTLTLGIGATTAVFSVVDGVILSPLPFPEPDRLVAVHGTSVDAPRNSLSFANFEDIQRDVREFEQLAGWRTDGFTLTGRGQPEALAGQMITANFFEALAVSPVLGRTFRPDEDRLGAARVAMVGEDYWRSRLGADPGVVGNTFVLDGQAHTIVGVAPSSVRFTRSRGRFLNDVYVPIGQYDDPIFRRRGVSDGTMGVARLRDDVSLERARATASLVATRLAGQYPDENRGIGVNVVGLADDLVGDRRAILVALLGAVGLVLLIACANVGNLLLARASARRHELLVRAALGAGRRRLASQIVAESVILSCAGGLCGVLAAPWLVRVALLAAPDALPAIAGVETNLVVLAFASGAAILTTLLVGVFPSFAAMRTPAQGHLASTRGVRGDGGRLQRYLVIAQVALTVVLLVGAGLLLRSLTQLWVVNPGLNPTNVLTFRTGLSPQRSTDPAIIRAAFAELDRRLASLPGVTAAGLDIGSPPFGGGVSALGFWRADRPAPTRPSEQQSGIFHAVGPDHFAAMGIPILRGRAFSRFDDERGARVMIVDEELARSTFPGEDAEGQHISLGVVGGSWLIVGVVRHVRHWGLDSDDAALVRSQFYIPHAQLPDVIARMAAGAIGGVVRSSAPQGAVAQSIRDEVARFDAGQAVFGLISMDDTIDESLAGRRFTMAVLGGFAGVALLLAVIGTYGVMSFIAGRRTPEIGVRMAVGAAPRDIVRLMLGEGGRIIGGGLLLGLPAAWVFGRALQGQLFRVPADDPFTFSTVTGLLAVVIATSCLAVARRAAYIDPVVALRQE